MQRVDAHGVPLWQAPGLSALARIAHGFTGRQGGVSTGVYHSLNLSLRLDDDRANVLANRRAALMAIGKTGSACITLKQVHGDAIVEVTANAGPSIEADALWTRDARATLAILVADCVPILLADRQGRAVAAVHAGWRGTQAKIGLRMVERLSAAGIPAKDLVVAIGPAIGPCCFAIGPEVVASLQAACGAAATSAISLREGQAFADLWQLNVAQLVEGGVPASAIAVGRICTVCTADCFSFRRDAGNTGRQAGLIALTGA